jgi:plasmid stabilization system protein ParE
VTDRFALRWAQAAAEDLSSIIDYVVDRDGVDSAERLYGQITEAAEKLQAMPRRCRVVPELEAEGITGYRELLVGPYRLMFAIRDGDVVVLTAVDGRRDLGELLIERALRGGA